MLNTLAMFCKVVTLALIKRALCNLVCNGVLTACFNTLCVIRLQRGANTVNRISGCWIILYSSWHVSRLRRLNHLTIWHENTKNDRTYFLYHEESADPCAFFDIFQERTRGNNFNKLIRYFVNVFCLSQYDVLMYGDRHTHLEFIQISLRIMSRIWKVRFPF